jgi:hypothetical protein
MTAVPPTPSTPAPELRPRHGAQVLGSLLVAGLIVLGAGGVAAASLDPAALCGVSEDSGGHGRDDDGD